METIKISVEKLDNFKHELVRFENTFDLHMDNLPDTPTKHSLKKGFKKVMSHFIEEIYDMVLDD